MRELSGRYLTAAYILALGLVALMSLASHLTLNRALGEHQGAASVLNISGRQRMLSQRIASLSAQAALGDPGARDALGLAIDKFAAAHASLINGNEALQLPAATTPELRHLYFEGASPLDQQVGAFIAAARRVQTLAPGDPGLAEALKPVFAAAQAPLLNGLDAVVTEHQRTSQEQLRFLQKLQNVSLGVVLLTLVAEAFGIFQPMVRRIGSYTRSLLALATIDPLTGALNRRSFTERSLAELARGNRHGRTASLLMIDADKFKAVNDTYGHGGGDAVLQALSRQVRLTLRPSDIFGRIGGEEFAVMLPETGLPAAEIAAERVRQALAALKVPVDATMQIGFTVSIGVAAFPPGASDLKATMDRADRALYRAKATGRNQVVVLEEMVAGDRGGEDRVIERAPARVSPA